MVLAIWKKGLPKREVLWDGIEVLRVAPIIGGSMTSPSGRWFKAIGWYLGILWSLRGKKVSCFNCHSLPVLPLSVMVKLWKRCTLVYEPHELETEVAGLNGFRQFLMRNLERMLIGRANAVCVVNPSIADWYATRYRLKPIWVVRNVPYWRESKPVRTGLLRKAVGLAPNAQVFLYQGLLVPGRGVELLIEAFSRLPPNLHLVFMGFGELEGRIRDAAALHVNIHFMSAVPPEQIQDYTVDADVGLALIENICLSYFFCLPNKLFEYSACGVPSIVSDFPEMAGVVNEFACGWKVVPDANALRRLIETLTVTELLKKSANTRSLSRYYCWQEEEKMLLAMYESLGFNAGEVMLSSSQV